MINQKNKHKNVQLILIGLFIVAFLAIVYYMGTIVAPRREKEELFKNKRYFDNFNESFKGIIVDINTPKRKLKGGVRQSLLKVKLDYSTIMHYEPRDSLSFYFCVLDFPYAEVFLEYVDITSIGDSILFDGINDTLSIKWHNWVNIKPDIVDNNIRLLEPFYTIPKYTKEQLAERIKTYLYPLNLPNDYYMILFSRFKEKEKLIEFHKRLSKKQEYKGKKIPKKYIKKSDGYYYYLYDETRYKEYKNAIRLLQSFGFKELRVAKFDKYNNFIKMIK